MLSLTHIHTRIYAFIHLYIYIMKAELSQRNNALASARTEAVSLKQRADTLERDLQQERARGDALEKSSYKTRVHAEAMSTENLTLRHNNEVDIRRDVEEEKEISKKTRFPLNLCYAK